jgi:tetratricopeptide (TPR) repeat protein
MLESNQIAEANMDRWAHAFGLDMLGMVALAQGQNEEALEYFQHSIAHSKEIGDQLNGPQTAIHMGQAYAALQSNDEAKRLFLEAYASAQSSKSTPILLNAFLSYVEIQHDLPAETKLAAALSVLAHPAVTPNLRARSECLRDEISSSNAIEKAEELISEKNAEVLAQEIMK